MFNPRRLRTAEAALVMLFFIQAWRAVLASLFGILYDYGFEGSLAPWTVIAVALVFVAFAAPLAAPRRYVRLALWLAAIGVAVARPTLNSDALLTRYWGGLAVLAAGSLYLAGLVRNCPRALATGLVGALVVDQLLRALGQTYDPASNPAFLLSFSLLAAALAMIATVLFAAHPQELVLRAEAGRLSWMGGLALGAIVFIETSLLALPNAVARWSDFEYAAIAPVFVAATCAFTFVRMRRAAGRTMAGSRLAGLTVMLGGLTGLAMGYQRWGAASAIGLLMAHLAALAALVQIPESNPARRPERTGLWLMLGLWLMVILTIGLNLTFTYAYTWPFMRGQGLTVYLLAGLIATQAAVTCRGSEPAQHDPAEYYYPHSGLIVVAAITLVVAIAAFPLPPIVNRSAGPLTAVTATIRYGYDAHWRYSLDEIARAIEQSGADIVTLQEVDTGRLSSFGVDEALYLARRLRMEVVYLPTIEHLTGLAILHRLPEVGRGAHLLPSAQEQTGVVYVHLRPGERDLHVYGTWLGIRGEDTLRQTTDLLAFIGDRQPAILGGAFFVMQDSPVYAAVNDAGFDFVALGLGLPPPPNAVNPARHVDYIWTRSVKPVRGWTPAGPLMNHAMVAVTFEF